MSAEIALLIPGLEQQLKACMNAGLSFSDYPTLTHIMRHPNKCFEFGFDQTLAKLFDLPIERDFPFAALQILTHTEKNEGQWKALLTPVVLIADKDGLLMDTRHKNDLPKDIFDDIVKIANDYDFQLVAVDKETWLLSSKRNLNITTTPVMQAQFQRIDTLLPKGNDAIQLQQFMNDCQMALAYAQQKRQFEDTQKKGTELPNAFWVHGSGTIPAKINHQWTTIYTDTHRLDGITQLTDCSIHKRPNSFSKIELDKKTLVLLSEFSQIKPEFNTNKLHKKLVELEINWLQPITTARKNKRLSLATLYPCDGQSYSIRKENLSEKLKRFCQFRS